MKPQAKTRIMYDANITFKQFGTYATLLKSRGLLSHEENRYITTTKGLQFIRAFTQLQNTIDDLSISSDRTQRVGRVQSFPCLRDEQTSKPLFILD
jgi:hypothetical protein